MVKCAESCCSRPKLSDLGFQVEDSSVFYCSQWSKIPWFVFVIYRVVLALYFLGYYVGDLIKRRDSFRWRSFLFLTTLAFIVFIIYLAMAAVVAVLDGFISRKRGNNPVMRIRHKIQWILFNITFSINVIVVVVYWSVLYNPSSYDQTKLFHDINLHLITAVIALIDLFLTAIPVRYLHVIYPVLFGLFYLTITLINWGAGGGIIYPILDYSNYPGLAAGSVVGVIVGIIIIHGLAWCLYKLRVWIWGRFGNNEIVEDEIKIEEGL